MTLRRALWVLILVVLAPGPIARAQTSAAREPQHVTIAELKRMTAEHGVRLVDVRDTTSFEAGHIPGAESMPLEHLARHLPELRGETRTIVTYCA